MFPLLHVLVCIPGHIVRSGLRGGFSDDRTDAPRALKSAAGSKSTKAAGSRRRQKHKGRWIKKKTENTEERGFHDLSPPILAIPRVPPPILPSVGGDGAVFAAN